MAYINSGKYNKSANGEYSSIDDLTFKGWQKGIYNKYPSMSIPKDALLDALNVDIYDDGTIKKRNGYTKLSLNPVHSLWNNEDATLGFMCDNNNLYYLDSNGNKVLVLANLTANAPMSYCEVNNEVYFTNGFEQGKLNLNRNYEKWIVNSPLNAPIITTTTGTLTKGRYIVAYTYQYKDFETGASPFSLIEIEDNQGINITCESNSDYTINIYVSMCNGEELFQVENNGLNIYTHNFLQNSGIELIDELLQPFPLLEQLFYYRARIYGVKGNALYFTDELNYRQYDPKNPFWLFEDDIVLAAPNVNGIYVATTKNTYWLRGNDHTDFEQIKILPTSAIKGSFFRDPNTVQCGFLSADGYIVLDENGVAKNITNTYLDFSKNYSQCAALVMQQDGIQKTIFSMGTIGLPTTMQTTDYTNSKNDDV